MKLNLFKKKQKNSADIGKITNQQSSSGVSQDKAPVAPPPAQPLNNDAKQKHQKSENLSKLSIKRSNIYILIAGIVCVGLFVTAVILSKNKKDNLPPVATAVPDPKAGAAQTPANTETLVQIEPALDITPGQVQMTDVETGTTKESTINIIIKDAAASIKDVKLNMLLPSLTMNQTCSARESMDVNESCLITLNYSPTEVENKSLAIMVSWSAVGKNEAKDQKTNTIQLAVSSKEPVVFNPPPPPEPEEEEEPEIEEVVEDFTPAPAMNEGADCRKYAAKARDKTGLFIGWIQANRSVMSPDCSRAIGTLLPNGKVISNEGDGEVIGMGPKLDNKADIYDERALQEIPEGLRDPIFDPEGEEEKALSYEAALANREIIKSGGDHPSNIKYEAINAFRADATAGDPYKVEDPLNIMGFEKDSFIPPSITDPAQISSFPKKNQFTLRENKAIPAVLNRSVKLFGAKQNGLGLDLGSNTEIGACAGRGIRVSATVERNVYGETGRSIILPAGTQVLGCVDPTLGDDVTKVYERVKMTWDRFIRPDGAEFNIGGLSAGSTIDTFTGDAQGQDGVPGKRDPGYMKRMLLEPLMYSILPMAVNLISPTTKQFSEEWGTGETGSFGAMGSETYMKYKTEGEYSSKEEAKAEIIENWRTVTQELMSKSMENFQPPFTIPAGSRITIFVQQDLILRLTETKSEMTGQESENN